MVAQAGGGLGGVFKIGGRDGGGGWTLRRSNAKCGPRFSLLSPFSLFIFFLFSLFFLFPVFLARSRVSAGSRSVDRLAVC